MTANAHSSPKPLILYPYRHRSSQCCSCHTVIPGDICFNCGRLSTLVVTPRPPRNSLQSSIIKVQSEQVVPRKSPILETKARCSPKPLILYPYRHRNSQCCSCHTVIPGDICFNCGRLSTLLVTPRPPRNSIQTGLIKAQPEPVIPRTGPILESKAFESQYALVETLLERRKEEQVRKCSSSCAFDTQLEKIEDLLDAGRKFKSLCTVAADDVPSATGERHSGTSCRRPLTPLPTDHIHKSSTADSAKFSGSSKSSKTLQPDHLTAENSRSYRKNPSICTDNVRPAATSPAPLSPGHTHKPSTTHSTKLSSSSKSSKTIQPDTFAAEDGFSEDGRPYRENVSRWMEDVRPVATSSAILSRRGVECRLRMLGKVCEWVIFL